MCDPPCSLLTRLFGEPGHDSLNNGMATVVGWGSTETDVDDEISIISTSSQQKLDMPVISIKDCINKFKKRGLDLTKDLRFLKIDWQYKNCNIYKSLTLLQYSRASLCGRRDWQRQLPGELEVKWWHKTC